jgi:hypothetical protein
MINNDDIPEIESSPLCREITREGTTVEIHIYRLAEGDNRWTLEVVDEEKASTVWDEEFETDFAALEAVMQTIDKEGIRSFMETDSKTLH